MRILHIVWGFSPLRGGGLIEYAEDIMEEQTKSGHKVASFFAGRRELFGRLRLNKWFRNEIAQYEIYNSPLVHLGRRGTFPAESELREGFSEKFFNDTLIDFKPDVVHIHELAGLPFTLLDICQERNIPSVLTLHDYYPLCPTLTLYNKNENLCRDISGIGCFECCRKGDDGGWSDRIRTMRVNGRSKWLFAVPLFLRHLWSRLSSINVHSREELVDIYRKRHHSNLARLRCIDVIIAQSNSVKNIYEERTGRRDIQMAHSSLSSIESLTAKQMGNVLPPVHFATLNGAIAPYKGAEILEETVKILKRRGYDGAYRLDIYGGLDTRVRRSLLSSDSVKWHGFYEQECLDKNLDQIDVGIVPSIWEEVYGYVGIEFLAKGIPVIGNGRGGIIDYTINGCSGWVNESCSAEELANIMEIIIRNPEVIIPLNRWIIGNRSKLIADRSEHLKTVSDCYEKAIASH